MRAAPSTSAARRGHATAARVAARRRRWRWTATSTATRSRRGRRSTPPISAATSRGLTRDFGLPRIAMAGNGRLDVVGGGTLAAPSLRVTARFPALAPGRDARAGADRLGVDSGPRRARGPRRRRARVDAVARRTARCGRRWSRCTRRAGARSPRTPRSRRRSRCASISRGRAAAGEAGDDHRRAVGRAIRRRPGRCAAARGCRSGTRSRCPASSSAPTRNAWRSICAWAAARAERARRPSRVDLGRLPRALVPPALGLGGTVDVDVRSRVGAGAAHRRDGGAGRRPHPRPPQPVVRSDGAARPAAARAGGCARAGWRSRRRATLRSSGRSGHRATRAPRSRWTSTSATPISAVVGGRRSADRRPADEGEAKPLARAREGAGARLDAGSTAASGSRGCRLAVAGRGLAFDEHAVGDLELTVSGEGDGIAHRAARPAPRPARTRIDVTTPLSLRVDPSHSRPTPRRWRARRSRCRGTLDRLPLAALARVAGPPRARRRDAVVAPVGLPARSRSPKGTVAIDVAGAADERFPPTDARIELDFDGGAVRGARPRLAQGAPAARRRGARRSAARPRLLAARAAGGRAAARPRGARAARAAAAGAARRETDREPPRAAQGPPARRPDRRRDGRRAARACSTRRPATSAGQVAVGLRARSRRRYADRKAKLDARSDLAGRRHVARDRRDDRRPRLSRRCARPRPAARAVRRPPGRDSASTFEGLSGVTPADAHGRRAC